MYDFRNFNWSLPPDAFIAAAGKVLLKPEQLVDVIKNSPNWTSKCRAVYLLSCDVGAADFAQKVADSLGVDVWAPTTKILWNKDWLMAPDWPPGKGWAVQAPGKLKRFPAHK